jgi:hypothetical protein
MVVSVEHLLSLNGLCDLYELCSILLSFYHSLTVLFSQLDSFIPHSCVVWPFHEACQGCYLNYGFNSPSVPSYLPLLYLDVSSWND